MRGETILPFVVLMAVESTAGPHTRAISAVDDPEAYRVYESVFRREWPVTDAKATRLVVRAETVRRDDCGLSGPALEHDWKPVVDAFERENATARVLLPGFAMEPPYVLVMSAELDMILARRPVPDDWWSGFYEAFPDSGGYFEVSAPGFNSAHTRAMVYVAYHCGSLCGGGTHHLLEKVDGAWREADPEGLSRCQWMARGIAPAAAHPLE